MPNGSARPMTGPLLGRPHIARRASPGAAGQRTNRSVRLGVDRLRTARRTAAFPRERRPRAAGDSAARRCPRRATRFSGSARGGACRAHACPAKAPGRTIRNIRASSLLRSTVRLLLNAPEQAASQFLSEASIYVADVCVFGLLSRLSLKRRGHVALTPGFLWLSRNGDIQRWKLSCLSCLEVSHEPQEVRLVFEAESGADYRMVLGFSKKNLRVTFDLRSTRV